MKAWAKSFYLSAAWEKTRAAYLMSQDYICERCGQPAKIVHHKHWLNRENINDSTINTICARTLRKLFPDFDFMFYLLLLLSSLAAFFAAAFDPSGSLSFVILYTIKHKIALMMNR